MPIVKEIEIPAEPCCGNCAAWKQTQGLNGECHLLPPVPMFAGFQQMPQVAGLQLNGKLPPQPIILAAFPAVNATNICRQWAPDQPPLAIEDAPRPEFVPDLVPDVDLKFVPDCPVEDSAYTLPREIEGAKHQDEIPSPACAHRNFGYDVTDNSKFCRDCGEKFKQPAW